LIEVEWSQNHEWQLGLKIRRQVEKVTIVSHQVFCMACVCRGEPNVVVWVAAFSVSPPQADNGTAAIFLETATPFLERLFIHVENVRKDSQVFLEDLPTQDQLKSLFQQPKVNDPFVGIRSAPRFEIADKDIRIQDDGRSLLAADHA
jgi:hypothetical protein